MNPFRLDSALLALAAVGLSLPQSFLAAAENWPQPAGPNGNWQVERGDPPTEWSVVREENIRWRTPMPEAGMSSVTVWGDRAFVTTHVPIHAVKDKEAVTDILGFCLDTHSGEILWQVELPGTSFISLAGGFTDGTVFAPITDGEHVWFFNRCGSMGCYDFDGKEIWLREWTPRFKHNNRQAEPFLIGDTLLYVEVGNKEAGARIQKWSAPGKKNPEGTNVPEGVEPKEVWTYVHGIDKKTGKVLWREDVGTSIHTTPVIGKTADGEWAISHARGGGHGPLEKPYGHSLTLVDPSRPGETLWCTELPKYNPPFGCHWNEDHVFGFHEGHHLVMDARDGSILRKQPLYEGASAWTWNPETEDWDHETGVAQKVGKAHPNTNQANLAIGNWHWFLSHDIHWLGRVHAETGAVEYLELPSLLVADAAHRNDDQWYFGKTAPKNLPLNAKGFAVGDKGHNGTGWGHISAASPTRVGRYLFLPVVTGTVYVIDTEVDHLSREALVAVNDLGPGGETWSLASLTFANGNLFAHTMKEIICIGKDEGTP